MPRAAVNPVRDDRASASPRSRGERRVRVWIDITNSPHVAFFRPLLPPARAHGHEVEVTARAFAQTLELLERPGIAHASWGRRTAAPGALGKSRAMEPRLRALRRGRPAQGFDLASPTGARADAGGARSGSR